MLENRMEAFLPQNRGESGGVCELLHKKLEKSIFV